MSTILVSVHGCIPYFNNATNYSYFLLELISLSSANRHFLCLLSLSIVTISNCFLRSSLPAIFANMLFASLDIILLTKSHSSDTYILICPNRKSLNIITTYIENYSAIGFLLRVKHLYRPNSVKNYNFVF